MADLIVRCPRSFQPSMPSNNVQDVSYNSLGESGDPNGNGNDSTNQILLYSSTWPTSSASGVEAGDPACASTTVAIESDVGIAQMPGLGLYRRHSQRNPRSCDVCRARKTACRVEGSPPCMTCRSLRRDCTFTERARKKRKLDHQPARQTTQSQESELQEF